MSDNKFFESQTESSRIKANIVANYFPKYCKIILKRPQKEIRFLDLFAGPGIYNDGSLSTPILIGDMCASDPQLKEVVHLMFNDNSHIGTLKKHFEERYPEGTFKYKPRFANKTVGEDERINRYLNKVNPKNNTYPTLLFFDPFGYKGINTITLGNFMGNWGNEIFLFLNTKRVNAAIDNNKFDSLMLELFPTTISTIKKDKRYKSSVHERLSLIIDNLANEFKQIVPNVFHCAFRFQEEDSVATSHYIIHFTKHERGYDLVKQIYNEFDNIGATLDKSGDYTFDAKKLDQPDCFFDFGFQNISLLSEQLRNAYSGKKILASELFNQHQLKTKYCRKHYCDTLRHMVEKGEVESRFTDNIKHTVSVLINEKCLLEFK